MFKIYVVCVIFTPTLPFFMSWRLEILSEPSEKLSIQNNDMNLAKIMNYLLF